MWKNWKKKVSNIFFEEVEDDELYDRQVVNEAHYPSMSTDRTVDTKMTYEYPKKQSTPFRFPVIPDEPKKNKLNKKIDEEIKPTRTSKRHRPQRILDKRPSIRSLDDEKEAKNLENIPAYIRRRKTEEFEQQQMKIKQREEKAERIKEIEVNHTSPDELDRIFKIRDGIVDGEKAEKAKKANEEDENIPLTSEPNNVRNDDGHSKPIHVEDKLKRQQQPSSMLKEKPIIAEKIKQEQVDHLDSELVTSETNGKDTAVSSEQPIAIPNHLLNDPVALDEDDSAWLLEQQSLLEQTLAHFNVEAKVVNVTQGPSVTRFEVQPNMGVKVSRIRNLTDDIKLNMAAKDIRMEAPIPGKNTIGIEVPNEFPQPVHLQEIIETEEFTNGTSPLAIALGLTIEGEPLITDIGEMPHGLIAGATGSGKSVCINTILLSLLYKANHQEVKFLLIDPKMVELTPYNGIPHLISPVITDVKAATMALKWAVDEMEDRYEKFVAAGVRNITKYNEKMTKQHQQTNRMPYIVIVIDELADLMMISPQEVEDAICRIAQKARACGIHLLLATQRPSVDVITGLIKANIPTRIAFSVSSQVDSRTIIDSVGAEQLLGKGDMLFVENGANKSVRLQGPFVSDEEIDRVANYMRSIAEPNYLFEEEQLLLEVQEEDEDELLMDVISFVVQNERASTSLLQRRFRIGYNRAARLIDTLEDKGIVSSQNGSKPREILVTKNQVDEWL